MNFLAIRLCTGTERIWESGYILGFRFIISLLQVCMQLHKCTASWKDSPHYMTQSVCKGKVVGYHEWVMAFLGIYACVLCIYMYMCTCTNDWFHSMEDEKSWSCVNFLSAWGFSIVGSCLCHSSLGISICCTQTSVSVESSQLSRPHHSNRSTPAKCMYICTQWCTYVWPCCSLKCELCADFCGMVCPTCFPCGWLHLCEIRMKTAAAVLR